MKNLIKDFLFIIIFIIILHIITNIFVLKGNTYGSDIISFYNLKKNSLDIIFFGSSHSYTAFSPEIIKKETGLNSYNFATQQQPIYITYHYMLETLKTQKPKFFVLEMKMLTSTDNYASEGVNRDAIDKMHTSINKIETINDSVENPNEKISYYFNIIKYHSRYNELTYKDIMDGIMQKGINNLGYKYLDPNYDVWFDNNEDMLETEIEAPILKNQKYLGKIVKLAKKNNIKLVFVKTPCKFNKREQRIYNWIKEYSNKKEIPFINYNEKIDSLKLKKGDYYDYGHLSGTGAKKISISFSNYINIIK